MPTTTGPDILPSTVNLLDSTRIRELLAVIAEQVGQAADRGAEVSLTSYDQPFNVPMPNSRHFILTVHFDGNGRSAA